MADLWDDNDDDDDILELVNRPPMSQMAVPIKPPESQAEQLMKAKGEVGVLRQKLSMLEKTLREHDDNQKKLESSLKSSHEEEVTKLA